MGLIVSKLIQIVFHKLNMSWWCYFTNLWVLGVKGSPVTTLQWHGCPSSNVWGSFLFFNPLFLASVKSALTDENNSESVGCFLNSKYFETYLIAPGISIMPENSSDELGPTCLRCCTSTMQRFEEKELPSRLHQRPHHSSCVPSLNLGRCNLMWSESK